MRKKQRQCTSILSEGEKAVIYFIVAFFFASLILTSCSPKMYGEKAGAKGCGAWHPKKFKA